MFVLIIGLFLFGSVGSAMAETKFNVKDWDISIGAWLIAQGYYTKNDKENPAMAQHNYDDTDLTFEDGASRLFVNFENGPYKGLFEIRAGENETKADTLFYYWMEWDFGAGKLMVGKNDPLTFDPLHLPPPLKSGIGQMIGYAVSPQVRLTVPVGPVTVAVAALKPDNYYNNITGGTTIVPGVVEVDNEMPVLEAKINFPIGPVHCGILGGMATYSEVDAANKEYDINSHMYGFIARYFSGPFSLHGSIFKDVNDYGHGGDPRQKGVLFYIPGSTYYGDPSYDAGTDSIVDSEYIGWGLSASYRINDTFEVHIGYSQGETEDGYGNRDESKGYEIATIIQLSEVVFLTPFFHITDWGTRTPVGAAPIEEGKTTTIGMQVSLMF